MTGFSVHPLTVRRPGAIERKAELVMRIDAEKSVWKLAVPNHPMPARALRLTLEKSILSNGNSSKPPNARKGIKTG